MTSYDILYYMTMEPECVTVYNSELEVIWQGIFDDFKLTDYYDMYEIDSLDIEPKNGSYDIGVCLSEF